MCQCRSFIFFNQLKENEHFKRKTGKFINHYSVIDIHKSFLEKIFQFLLFINRIYSINKKSFRIPKKKIFMNVNKQKRMELLIQSDCEIR